MVKAPGPDGRWIEMSYPDAMKRLKEIRLHGYPQRPEKPAPANMSFQEGMARLRKETGQPNRAAERRAIFERSLAKQIAKELASMKTPVKQSARVERVALSDKPKFVRVNLEPIPQVCKVWRPVKP